jgi:hypothetical protein
MSGGQQSDPLFLLVGVTIIIFAVLGWLVGDLVRWLKRHDEIEAARSNARVPLGDVVNLPPEAKKRAAKISEMPGGRSSQERQRASTQATQKDASQFASPRKRF